MALSDLCHETHRCFVWVIVLLSVYIETFNLVLSSEKSVTMGFYCFGFGTWRGFLKVLRDEFVSFGVHNFLHKQLISDLKLILLGDVR